MSHLSQLQRAAPPMDRWSARRGPSSGGRDTAVPLTLAPGMENDLARYPFHDGRIVRDRWPFYQHPRYMPPPVTWISWTAAGPARPELHMRNMSWRVMAGDTAARFPVVPGSPTGGMHTMIPGPGGTRTVARYVQTPQMNPPRQNRTAAGQYSGQTYSQTTLPQGR